MRDYSQDFRFSNYWDLFFLFLKKIINHLTDEVQTRMPSGSLGHNCDSFFVIVVNFHPTQRTSRL